MPSYGFFLSNVCQLLRQGVPPIAVYRFFHQKIAEIQEKKYAAVKFILDKIDDKIRLIHVNTSDETERRIIREKSDMLNTMRQEIHDELFKDDSDFLDAVKKVVEWNSISN